MYIEGKYWNHYIGDTDDSLTLAAYLADKGKKEISGGDIFRYWIGQAERRFSVCGFAGIGRV